MKKTILFVVVFMVMITSVVGFGLDTYADENTICDDCVGVEIPQTVCQVRCGLPDDKEYVMGVKTELLIDKSGGLFDDDDCGV